MKSMLFVSAGPPKCITSELPVLGNMTVDLPSEERVDPGEEVSYQCLSDHYFPDDTQSLDIVCEGTGYWQDATFEGCKG